MPPRRKRNKAVAAPADHAPSLATMPPDVLEVVAAHLVSQDQLNNPQTAARDIASLAQASK